jgi:hypothetical protein
VTTQFRALVSAEVLMHRPWGWMCILRWYWSKRVLPKLGSSAREHRSNESTKGQKSLAKKMEMNG